MALKAVIDEDRDLDYYVEQFELARGNLSSVNLADYLPDPRDSLFSEVLSELIRIDLEYGWKSGNRKSLQNYADEFPAFFRERRYVEAVAYEEFRLRRQHGDAVSAEEYESRFGIDSTAWPSGKITAAQSSGTAKECIGTQADDRGRIPQVGERFLDFQLIAELGRGAFGTVYLAQQGDLAQRSVALKISRELFVESQALAQLQHTNIVPIYSVHRAGALQAVCMPFFGATTLAHMLGHWRQQGSLPPSGKAIVETLANQASTIRSTQAAEPPTNGLVSAQPGDNSPTPAIASLQALAGLNYVEAVLWIGARLADGLAHAHQRGILHQDLKPANVLLADDGRPMLLDFNLSRDTKRKGSAAGIGGTLPYMAPEQLIALRDGVEASELRSDLYSLGVILYEMLAGQQPFPCRQGPLGEVIGQMLNDRQTAARRLRDINLAITPAVEAIVRRCLEANPNRRYQTATALQEDLERQLESRPLKNIPEPALVERTQKWLRRHPRLTSATSVVIGAAAVFVFIVALLFLSKERLAQFESAAAYEQFKTDMRSAQVAAMDAAAGTSNRDHVSALCRRALNQFDALTDDRWQQSVAVRRLPALKQQQLSDDVGELLFLMAAMTADDAQSLHERAWVCYRAGEQPAALTFQRRLLAKNDQGGPPSVEIATDAKTARDTGMLATLLSLQHRFREALPHWQAATGRDPQNAWAWFGLGVCYEQLLQPQHSASAFTACISLVPDRGEWYFHRGIAYLKEREPTLAILDFDRALAVGFDRPELRVNRALAWLNKNDYSKAIAELEQVLETGPGDVRSYLILARAREQNGDAAGAAVARKNAMLCEPSDDLSWVTRGVAILAGDSKKALACFEHALRLNPHCLAALENKAHVLAEKLSLPNQAIEALDEAIKQYPEQALLYAVRGVLQARLGDDAAARSDAVKALDLDDSDHVRYQASGIYAVLSRESPSDRREALALLSSALRHGHGTNLIEGDIDLEPLHDDPQFKELVAAARTLHEFVPDGSAASGEGSD